MWPGTVDEQRDGAKYQSVMLERETVNELYRYAAQQGLSVNEAVQTLIQIARDARPGRGSHPAVETVR